ncbi:hypothetical protein [Thiohalomonas denitrificans]|uniref:hypothetical protein n=1 Tax=Thiohalomonas denitrificans TaxID=415747 RepID=UPI0026F2D857|nr:hypothetical protein [Thiohalomonas denitrificans]
MSDEERKQREETRKTGEKPAEPRSPGAATSATNAPAGGSLKDRDQPDEGELPRREDMHPGDHRARKEEDGEEEEKSD